MTEQSRNVVLNDDQWAVRGPLIDECRPRGKTEPVALRETIEAIVWRHQNGAACRPIWWRAAQTFIRWSKLGVWERLLEHVQERGVELGMAFLDGTSIPQSGGGVKKRGSGAQRDVREALGRSRGGYGTKACVITDGAGRAI